MFTRMYIIASVARVPSTGRIIAMCLNSHNHTVDILNPIMTSQNYRIDMWQWNFHQSKLNYDKQSQGYLMLNRLAICAFWNTPLPLVLSFVFVCPSIRVLPALPLVWIYSVFPVFRIIFLPTSQCTWILLTIWILLSTPRYTNNIHTELIGSYQYIQDSLSS